jgi:PAS domain S-box-containing protein
MSLSNVLLETYIGAMLDEIVNNSLSSVMVTRASADTPIVYVNQAFTVLTGYASDAVIGKSPRMLQGPKTDAAVLERLRADLEGGRIFEGQAINYRNNGSEFLMHWRVLPVNDPKGVPVYFIALQEKGHV